MIQPGMPTIPAWPKLLAVISVIFTVVGITEHPNTHPLDITQTLPLHAIHALYKAPQRESAAQKVKLSIRKLAGPYAHLVIAAAHKAHVPPKLVAAVVQVENGGNFHGSATRVSSAGAIGVMQLEPDTAWNTLRVNPWNARQNIDGGARYLASMLHQFGGNVRLALMAYNAGPTSIAQGVRPWAAVAYAKEVMRDAGDIHYA